MLHTMFEVQSIHLQAALWMGMPLSQIRKIPSFWEWPPPSLRNNWGPRFVLFPFFYVWVSFFFTRAGQVFFFSSHVGQVFFFFFYVWVKFFFLPLSGSSFFFFTKTSCSPPPPLRSNGASLNARSANTRKLHRKTLISLITYAAVYKWSNSTQTYLLIQLSLIQI